MEGLSGGTHSDKCSSSREPKELFRHKTARPSKKITNFEHD